MRPAARIHPPDAPFQPLARITRSTSWMIITHGIQPFLFSHGWMYIIETIETNLYTSESSEPCRTLTIYDYPGSDKSAKDIFCYDHWDVETVYRRTTTPSTTTSSSSTSKSMTDGDHSSMVHSNFQGSTLTPGPSLTTSLPTATATSTTTKSPNSDNSDSDSDSQAWIAGAVIGPVAGCAILAGLAFWLFRRRKRANTQAEPAPVTSALPPQYGQMENVKYGGGGQPLSELPGSYYVPKQQERPLSELGGS